MQSVLHYRVDMVLMYMWAGSDAIVTKIARLALAQAGLPLRVATGATPYPTKEDLPLIEHDILFEQDGGS